jgi:hypothetical protein
MYSDEELKGFHRHSLRNEPEVKASRRCGCFYCFGFFSPADIDEWWDKGDDDGRDPLPLTAVCPLCGIDSVLPESPDYVLDTKFIEAMGASAFNGYAPGNWLFRRTSARRSLSIEARHRHRLARYDRRSPKALNTGSERMVGLLDGWHLDELGDLVAEIRALEDRLAHPDQQTFYFQETYDEHERRLSELKERYETIRLTINTTSLNDLLQRADMLETKWQEQKSVGVYSLKQAMAVGRLERLYRDAEALIGIKKRFESLEPIEGFDPERGIRK